MIILKKGKNSDVYFPKDYTEIITTKDKKEE